MDIKHMIYFKTIVEAGTISKAAKILHMAQPPLSMQLKQLEDELGVQLLKRGYRKVELTDAGRLFYKRSLQMISLSETTFKEMQNIKNEILRIGITSSNSSYIQYIYDDAPTLTYHIFEGTTYEIIDLLNAHTIDIGIIRTPFDQSDVNVINLPKEPMLAIGLDNHLQPHMKHMHNYQGYPLIIHQRYLRFISDYCLHNHFQPFIKITSDDCRSSILYATYGYGIAIIPQSAKSLINDPRLITVEIEDQELYTNVAIITRKNEPLDLHIQHLIETFTQKFHTKSI